MPTATAESVTESQLEAIGRISDLVTAIDGLRYGELLTYDEVRQHPTTVGGPNPPLAIEVDGEHQPLADLYWDAGRQRATNDARSLGQFTDVVNLRGFRANRRATTWALTGEMIHAFFAPDEDGPLWRVASYNHYGYSHNFHYAVNPDGGPAYRCMSSYAETEDVTRIGEMVPRAQVEQVLSRYQRYSRDYFETNVDTDAMMSRFMETDCRYADLYNLVVTDECWVARWQPQQSAALPMWAA